MGHLPAIIWLTGLSGAGKTTLAHGASRIAETFGIHTCVIDGDVIRTTICQDLGFSYEDRCENIRRAGELAIMHASKGALVFVALVSPFELSRRNVAHKCGACGLQFALVHVHAPISCCENRDTKGFYKLARSGHLPMFTGISSPYELPPFPTLTVYTDTESVEDSVFKVATLALKLVRKDRQSVLGARS